MAHATRAVDRRRHKRVLLGTEQRIKDFRACLTRRACDTLGLSKCRMAGCVKFGAFELDLQTLELRKSGLRLRVPEQSLKILAILLARPGGGLWAWCTRPKT